MSGSYLTDERRMIQEQARDFTIREVLPAANKLDPEKGEIPMALREKMAEMGYFGILVDKKYGGLGLGVFEYCLVTEELARGWMGVASIIARANNVPGMEKLSEERRAEIMPRVARGEWLGAFAMSEPNAGSDISNSSCRARRDGDSWVIHGNKCKQHKGCRLSSSLKSVGSSQRGCVALRSPKIGYHGWKTWELAFDACRVPADALLGEKGEGFYIVSKGLEKARAHTAARAIGLACGALEDSIGYAGEREPFDNPIARFQAIRFKIAQMATEIGAARQLFRLHTNQQRRPLRSGSLHDQAVRHRYGGAGDQRGDADPWWRPLHHSARGGAPLARRAPYQNLQGHVRDPVADYLGPAARQMKQGHVMKLSQLTERDNYFEDFVVGDVMKHVRSKTLEPLEQVLITNMVMNTASGHFDEEVMKTHPVGKRLSFGGVNISMFIGLASQDTAENAIAELGMDKIRLQGPVFHGDTLTAYTEVLEVRDAERDDAGVVHFKHYGTKQDGSIVFEGQRTVLMKRRSHWGQR